MVYTAPACATGPKAFARSHIAANDSTSALEGSVALAPVNSAPSRMPGPSSHASSTATVVAPSATSSVDDPSSGAAPVGRVGAHGPTATRVGACTGASTGAGAVS